MLLSQVTTKSVLNKLLTYKQMIKYGAFLKGKLTPEENANMFATLEKYCKQDTFAMVKLMKVLYQYAKRSQFKK